MGVQTIGHQVEFTIRGDERNVTLLFELVKAHALMELDVLHLDELSSRCPILHLKEHLVVKAELKFWHTAQIGAHVNAPEDL